MNDTEILLEQLRGHLQSELAHYQARTLLILTQLFKKHRITQLTRMNVRMLYAMIDKHPALSVDNGDNATTKRLAIRTISAQVRIQNQQTQAQIFQFARRANDTSKSTKNAAPDPEKNELVSERFSLSVSLDSCPVPDKRLPTSLPSSHKALHFNVPSTLRWERMCNARFTRKSSLAPS